MSVQKSTIIWSFVLIVLTNSLAIDGAKATRRGGTKSKSPNSEHYALSYGGSHGHRNTQHQSVTHKPVQHQPIQQHQQVHQQHAPSAPNLPNNNNNKPIGWNVPHQNTPEQSKTVTNTNSALPYPNNPPPYTSHAVGHPPAGPPPPYSQNSNAGFQSNVPAGPPPSYSNQNGGFHSNIPAGQPPAYQPNPAYPMHNAGANYPQQPYNSGQSVYPGAAIPNHQPAPVINNFYGQPQTGNSGSGGSFLQTLGGAAAGSLAGSLAGNALYGALKPESEHKTVIIHENAASSNVAASVPSPAAIPTSAGESPTAPAPATVTGNQQTVQQSNDPQTTMQQPQTDVRAAVNTDPTNPSNANVPLAPLPDTTNPANVSMDTSPETTYVAPTTITTTTTTTVTQTGIPNQTVDSPKVNVPLASFPPGTDPSAHAQKGSATTAEIFNVSVYTIIALIIAKMF